MAATAPTAACTWPAPLKVGDTLGEELAALEALHLWSEHEVMVTKVEDEWVSVAVPLAYWCADEVTDDEAWVEDTGADEECEEDTGAEEE